jgi:hypothetical protein
MQVAKKDATLDAVDKCVNSLETDPMGCLSDYK